MHDAYGLKERRKSSNVGAFLSICVHVPEVWVYNFSLDPQVPPSDVVSAGVGVVDVHTHDTFEHVGRLIQQMIHDPTLLRQILLQLILNLLQLPNEFAFLSQRQFVARKELTLFVDQVSFGSFVLACGFGVYVCLAKPSVDLAATFSRRA